MNIDGLCPETFFSEVQELSQASCLNGHDVGADEVGEAIPLIRCEEAVDLLERSRRQLRRVVLTA